MLKHFLFLFIIFFPISLSLNPFSIKSLTKLIKYSDAAIKMDGIVYTLVLNVEVFVIFEDTILKFLLKKTMKYKFKEFIINL